MAVFLFISGLTGAVISWDHELDEWLNPQLFKARTSGEPLPALELANRFEAQEGKSLVTFLPLAIEPGHALVASVKPRIDPATGKPYATGYNQIAIDPVTATVQGQREWGAVSLDRENFLPFLYKLHYSMHIPDGFGLELGVLFMGIVAIVWVLDSFIALWISFPNRAVWKKSFAFRWRQGGHKPTFDLHRSGGVWLWLFVLMLAVTSVSMNLREQVVRPVVSMFSILTPSPFASRTPQATPATPKVTRESVIAQAAGEARQRGWASPIGGVFYSPDFDIYGVGFFEPGKSHGDDGLGNAWLYYDGQTGMPAGADIPGTGSAGDIFLQAQFPLHSGRILGIPGRVLMSFMGLALATLSATGILIWARKRRARQRALQQRAERGRTMEMPGSAPSRSSAAGS